MHYAMLPLWAAALAAALGPWASSSFGVAASPAAAAAAAAAGGGAPEHGGGQPSLGSLGVDDWKAHIMAETDARLRHQMTARLGTLLEGTTSIECAEEVAMSYEAFLSGHLTETLLPFESPFVSSQCPPEPPADIPMGFKPPEETRLLYVVTAHRDWPQVVRMIRALQDDDDGDDGAAAANATTTSSRKIDPLSSFVVHVDGKVGPKLPAALMAYAATAPNVYLMQEGRVNVSWGGFSVVQATLNAISYGFYLGLPFDRVINLSGATYPLATPATIRRALARHPVNEQLMLVDPNPTVPVPRVWHYFVECDNRMHRIARFVLPRGVPLRTGSQWFIVSRDFAHYLLTDQAFVAPYTAYAQHILIPDENFFATVLLSSPYCHFHANANYLYHNFDVWEDEKGELADRSKCLQPDPGFCGRSPKLVSLEEVPTAMNRTTAAAAVDDHDGGGGGGTSNNPPYLFARKFETGASDAALAEIDRLLAEERAAQGSASRSSSTGTATAMGAGESCDAKAGGACLAAKESVLAKHGISLEGVVW